MSGLNRLDRSKDRTSELEEKYEKLHRIQHTDTQTQKI